MLVEMHAGPVGRALVAGGAGFLGSYVCDRLMAEGKMVICLDNLMTGRLTNIQHLLGRPGFSFVRADIRNHLQQLPVDEVWNLACPASPPRYQADPIDTMMICVAGTLKLLEIAAKFGARFFQASTSEVYGDPDVHPQTEAYRGAVNTIGPRACYDEGKRAAETLCYDFRRVHNLDVRVARIFNTYGPRMDPEDGRVVSNFIVRALAGEPLEYYGEGHQTRSFCYSDDLIEGLFRLMRRLERPESPVNIGNPIEFSVRELGELVLELTGSRSTVVMRPMPEDDPKQRRPDISQAQTLLDWRPAIELRDGLLRTIDYFSQASSISVKL